MTLERWRLADDTVVIDLEAPALRSSLGPFESDLREDGIVDASWQFRATFRQWAGIGEPPEDAEPELLESWAVLQSELADVLGTTQQRLELASVGHVGAMGATLTWKVDGHQTGTNLAFAAWPSGVVPLPAVARALVLAAAPASTRPEQLARWARTRKHLDTVRTWCGRRIEVAMDEHLEGLHVRCPSQFALNWVPAATRASACSLELSERTADGQQIPVDLTALDDATGIVAVSARYAAILPGPALEIARRARRYQRQLVPKVEALLRDPAQLIPEGSEVDSWLDLSQYSDRVLGFEKAKRSGARPVLNPEGTCWYEDPGSGDSFLTLALGARGTRSEIRLVLETPDDARRLLVETNRAMESDPAVSAGASFTFDGMEIRPEATLRDTVRRALTVHDERVQREAPSEECAERPSARYVAVIAERAGDDAFDMHGVVVDESAVPWSRLDQLLRPGVVLKTHQRRGVAWLWHQRTASEPGALLADAMGLGKTLQVAALLALELSASGSPPLPALVVSPTILLETWIEEMEKFFREGVFDPMVVLHGDGLRRLRLASGELDVERIERARLVLTNYDTLGAHQLSLLRANFSIVVFDEAQAIKNETTMRSRAAQGLKRSLAIAMTGTPVENRLSDLWAIFDALQPVSGRRAFGNRKSFDEQYDGPGGVAAVRGRLKFPSATSVVLRREKAEALRDLPPKSHHVVRVAMTEQQYELERFVVRQLRSAGTLTVLDRLRKLYQHPALLENDHRVALDVDSALSASPKTLLTIDLLREIAARGEKALVFTQWRQMQNLLEKLLRSHLGLRRVNIINGDPGDVPFRVEALRGAAVSERIVRGGRVTVNRLAGM